jgi:hypothetical protein
MAIMALAKLQHRSAQLKIKLAFGTTTEITAARELLRQSLVELYELHYWRKQPEQFKIHMQLYRACRASNFSAPESMSAPDRRDQYSP